MIKDLVKEHVKAIVTVGDGAKNIEKFFKGIVPLHPAEYSMEKAVEQASSLAVSGDVVLLSPACASFDMFNNYEHRGKVFKDLVNKL